MSTSGKLVFIIPFKSSDKTPERDINIRKCLNNLDKLKYRYCVSSTNEFTWAGSLNSAINLYKQENPDINIFCLDADMIVPEGFDNYILDNLKTYDAIFPVCWSLNEDGSGWWRHSGHGLCGFNIQKFPGINDLQSGPDDDLFSRCKDMKVLREEIPGLIHQWHPNSIEYKNINLSVKRLS